MRVTSPNSALVIVDSDFDQRIVAEEVLLPVLKFWGLPYERLDLASLPARQPDPAAIGLVIFLQEGIPGERFESVLPTIAAALSSGAGIVNCDPGLGIEASDGGRLLRLAQHPWSHVKPVRSAQVAGSPHFVTRMQRFRKRFPFRKPVPSLPAKESRGAIALLTDEAGVPLLELDEKPVRIASWRLSNWVWSEDFFGFAHGMDALFWRSLLWAARKPFAMAAFPPFGRFRFDDCRGLWRTPEDLRFLNVMKEFGEVPNLGICLSAVTGDGWKCLAERAARGEIEVSPHVLEPEVGIFNAGEDDTAGAGPDPLAERIGTLFRSHGCPMAESVSDHNHELSARGIGIARRLGLKSRMNVMRAGERWETLHRRWRPAPFGSMHYALDRFVDAPELFTAINHHASFSDSFLALGNDRFLCTSFGGFTEDRWDFLNGLVGGPDAKDLDAALERLLTHAELALTSLFFAGSITHTHFASLLTNDDWKRLLTGYRGYVDAFGYQPRPYDQIVAYACERHELRQVRVDPEQAAGKLLALVVRDRPDGPVESWCRAAEASA